jgi:hypothetical protein
MGDILVSIFIGLIVVLGFLVTDFDDRRHAAIGVLIAVSILAFGWFSVIGIALWGLWALVKKARRKRVVRRRADLNDALWNRSLTRSEFDQMRRAL